MATSAATTITLSLASGAVAHGLRWAPSVAAAASAGPRCILLHGWLDNAASFTFLAPRLAAAGVGPIVALDFPGHGLTSAATPAPGLPAPPQIGDYVSFVHEAAEALGWADFALVGHSLGAGVSAVFAGTFPDRVTSLTSLEALGPESRDADVAPRQLRESVRSVASLRAKAAAGPKKAYATLDEAVAARVAKVGTLPGAQYLSDGAARAMVTRGTGPAEGGGVRFLHDAMTLAPSRQSLTEEQVLAFLREVQCPHLGVTAIDGWPFPAERMGRRIEVLHQCPGGFTHHHLPGSHHHHLDEDTAHVVAELVERFLVQQRQRTTMHSSL